MANITKARVKEFVEAAHGNLPKVQEMLAQTPELLDLPNGNETALGAACQMRHPEMIAFLLAQGALTDAQMDLAVACILGQTDRVTSILEAAPALLTKGNKRSHNKHPAYFAEHQSEVLTLLQSLGAKTR